MTACCAGSDLLLLTRLTGHCCRYSAVIASPNGEWLQQVADLIQSGKAIARVDRVFPLEETAKAHEYFEARKQTQGKVILQIHA